MCLLNVSIFSFVENSFGMQSRTFNLTINGRAVKPPTRQPDAISIQDMY